jgi:hypothetical protein
MSDDAAIADTLKDVAGQAGGMVDDVTKTVSQTYAETGEKTLSVIKNTTEADGHAAGQLTGVQPKDGYQATLFDHGAAESGGTGVTDHGAGTDDPVPDDSAPGPGADPAPGPPTGPLDPAPGVHQLALGGDSATGDVTTDRDGAVFWSGATEIPAGDPPPWPGAKTIVTADGKQLVLAGADNAKTLARGMGKSSLEGLIEDRGITMPDWEPNNPDIDRQWSEISGRYAEGVSGNVTVVLGDQLRPGNVWETTELPRLMANPNVTGITKINLTTLEKTTIFTRGAP